ncbi:hypothetical protein ANOM_001723 [Aspergillus nomiae NRRL 13137]|uniref:Uncharacterized protein n=1 Tax=Aspergillus nomiae NRRL (strain ATCC 15546 / NRRL 13137 / CBS 260.88 / M93) TaxID=1509407 RepID=A0A0L1JDN5_ASPN3|nr:uncharacterized protein ANOM_001723 [Aspergillus nomiae NRRL 13137]KNG89899.1 hypothetical protein ANOM_001723 [Aspergillus nomiae NRRL 13137]
MEHAKDEYRLSYVRMDDPPEHQAQRQPLSASDQAVLVQASGSLGSSWIWEILSCVIAVASLAGIIVVLYMYDGKSMPDWPYGITLNAVISLLTTLMKAAMAFPITEALSQLKWSWFSRGNKLSDLAMLDAASRGPFGAALVLLRFIPRYLVTVGCLVLVVAAAIAPFVQQVIAINMRPVHSSNSSSIQICNTSMYTDYGEGFGPGQNEVPLSTLASIYTGIFQDQSAASPSVMSTCPTGNCTFVPYQSLGFCSRCANITDQLTLNKSSLGFSTMESYDYRLPNGFSFSTSQTGMYLMNSTNGLSLLQIDTKDLPLIMNFTAITASGYGVPPKVSATECALYFCIDTYEANVKDGKFNERITSSATSTNLSANAVLENFALTPDTCYVNGTQRDDKGECTYSVNAFSRLAMVNSLTPLLNGTGQLYMSNRPYWSTDTAKALYGVQGNLTDISTVFTSLATSLTTHARNQVCKASVKGMTWTVESFVSVRWPWMILPIALVAMTILFLVVTMIKTRNQYIWKSSPLALLFSDLAVDGQHSFERNPSLSGMEDVSKKMNVWLEITQAGVKLKGIPR